MYQTIQVARYKVTVAEIASRSDTRSVYVSDTAVDKIQLTKGIACVAWQCLSLLALMAECVEVCW